VSGATTLLLLLANVAAALLAIAYVPEHLFGWGLIILVIVVTFIVGFLRGYAVCTRMWETKAYPLATLLAREGVPVTINEIAAPNPRGFERSL
jgi:hypothetical protein